jgi:acyl-CoA synthetase (AMP-forming)/AMP-acid ligase II
MFAVPVMLTRIVALPEAVRTAYDTSALRFVASSGSALPAATVTAFLDSFGDILYNLYGSTEVSWVSVATPRELRASPGTAGRPPLGTRLALLDPAGRPVAPGATGRVFVGNGMLFGGYTGGELASRPDAGGELASRPDAGGELASRPEAGGELASRPEVLEGLMSTGDLGHLDAAGLLYVDGREDDMVVCGGENVFPREVEDVLAAALGVREAAVVGVPDAEYGQRLAAFVVPEPGGGLDGDAVRELVRAQLARHCVPRDVTFLDELPRNATGKVLARELRERSR